MFSQLKQLFASKEFLILNGVIVLFLALILPTFPLVPSSEIVLQTVDSITYYNSGSEVFDLTAKGSSWVRPFFYSSFLYVTYNIGGAWLVVILQLLMWIASANFVFYTLKNYNSRLVVRIIGTSIFIANISLLSYVFHGLTEIISVFFLSWVGFIFSQIVKVGYERSRVLAIIFILGILTVIKPLFEYPFLLSVAIGIFVFIRKKELKPKMLIWILLVVSPVVIQYSLMKIKYNELKISGISGYTFDTYLVAQGIREVEGIKDVKESQEKALAMSKDEKKHYMWKNRNTYLHLYFFNIKNNITGYGNNIILPPGIKAKKHVDFMVEYNEIHYSVFRVLFSLFLLFSLLILITRQFFKNWHFLALGFLFYYVIFTSGISFWQAERLTIFSLPIWIVLYLLIIERIRNFSLNDFKKVEN